MNVGLPPGDWDKELQAKGGSFLQSRPWAQFQMAIGREIVWGQAEQWMWLAVVRGKKGLKYLLCSYGPVATDVKSASDAFQSLQEAGKRLGCDFVRVEPRGMLQAFQMRQAGGRQVGEVQPAHTQILDLSASMEELRKGLASGHRNLINGTERRKISVSTSVHYEDFEQFLKMMDDTAKRSRVTFFPGWYYRGLWKSLQPEGTLKLYIARADIGESQGNRTNSSSALVPVAAVLVYDWGGTRIYAHAGAYQDLNRKLNASVSLVWQAIIDAKEDGISQFDLWGVASTADPQHKWAGLTKFKKGFGGHQLDYLGTWDIPINRPKYALYSLYRKLKGRR